MGIVPTDGTGAAQSDEREFRYFLVSTAALGRATACPYLSMCGAETQSTIAGRENEPRALPRPCPCCGGRMIIIETDGVDVVSLPPPTSMGEGLADGNVSIKEGRDGGALCVACPTSRRFQAQTISTSRSRNYFHLGRWESMSSLQIRPCE
jgi:hypothetical protein